MTILNLFGRSPFAPLKAHMDNVANCVHKLPELFDALISGDFDHLNTIAAEISKLEHQADTAKNDIRNHLPKSLFLPVDRNSLLEILSLQDSLADRSEDVAVMFTLKPIELPETMKNDVLDFLKKNIEAFDASRAIINEMHDLLESSFGGIEADKVRKMVDHVAFIEHEADLIQRKLLKILFSSENSMHYTTFYFWQRTLETLGALSNLSEKLSYRVRQMLEMK